MSTRRLEIVEVSDRTEDAWRAIHNQIIPASPLSRDDVRERRQRNLLTLAYVGDELVGNATVRPPSPESPAATVIVRILPEHRRQGFGSEYLDVMLEKARSLDVERIETVVLVSNTDGLRFAGKHGFTEFERYVVDDAEYAELVLDGAPVDAHAQVSRR